MSYANVYLIGLMGAGKTTVGRQLAKRTGRRFVDSDHEIEARAGVRIPFIFEKEGEAGFRQREAQMLVELAQRENLVVATGGGIVLLPENRAILRSVGTVIYLNVPPRVLFERIRHDRNRPLLQVPEPYLKLEELHASRDALYREVADIVIDTQGGLVSHLVNLIEKELSRCVA
ncbi:MAG TPA: shikimate kinase [Rhodocyclaceae bacterium]|nr:shikimate kinase [Rhodocyclaceae bacterium]